MIHSDPTTPITLIDPGVLRQLRGRMASSSSIADVLDDTELATILELCDAYVVLQELRLEVATAMHVLDPAMPESGIEQAARQVKQVAMGEADNADYVIEEVGKLKIRNALLTRTLENAADNLARIRGECELSRELPLTAFIKDISRITERSVRAVLNEKVTE